MAVSPSGKRLNHQRRIPKAVLDTWAESLLARRRQILGTKTFEALHNILSEAAANVHGIGPLTVYDTATRIGVFLRREPERVYVHAGVEQGAKALGFRSRKSISPDELPGAFRRLSADEMEDCLCIYKRQLAAIRAGRTLRARAKAARPIIC